MSDLCEYTYCSRKKKFRHQKSVKYTIIIQIWNNKIVLSLNYPNGSRIEMTDVWNIAHDESTLVFNLLNSPVVICADNTNLWEWKTWGNVNENLKRPEMF